MYQRIFTVMVIVAGVAGAQAIPQRAAIVGGGNPNVGQCTIAVVVDGTVQVDVLGADGMLRNLGGAAPQWQGFECTSAMPANPANFQFMALSGRGQQKLTLEPRNGGPAVVRIEDPEGGAGEYTFRLTWNNGPAGQDRGPVGARDDRGFQNDRSYQGDRGPQGGRGQDLDSYHRDRDNSFRGNGGRALLFQRIREDLDHATSGAFPFTGDRARLERTQMELDELQQKLAQGFYDERELDDTMAALQAVVQGNRLAPRDRAMLTDDLKRMRDFRMRHDQYGARDIEGPYHRERDQRFAGNDWRQRFFEQIREDLDHVASSTFPFGGDQARLSRTKFELDELQEKLSRGFYDEQELDEVIGALEVVLQSNRLGSRDGEILSDDLSRMRDFRLRHDEYGAR